MSGNIKKVVFGAIAVVIIGVAQFCFGDLPEEDLNNDQADNTVVEDKEVDIQNRPKLENYLPVSKTGEVIEHEFFTLSYSEIHKQPEWVAYELSSASAQSYASERGGFRPDPNLGDRAIKPSDYTNSGYDRGHLLPAADMAFSTKAMEDCFYMSNVSPQEPRFNRGIWKKLEEQVRNWAVDYEHLYIVTGPVLTRKAKKRFPRDKGYIAVPHSFYKIILDYHGQDVKAIAFWMDHEESDAPLKNFAYSVDELERITGLDFFPDLPDDLEEKIESSSNIIDWGLHKEN